MEPLSADAVALLAAARNVDADELYLKTSGNPFFVTEALAAVGEGIPNSVRDAVLARAARLGGRARAVLEAVAVVPPQAELWLLDALAADTAEELEECLSSRMLASGPGAVTFRHELARLAVEESLSPNRSIALHRKALEALTAPEARVVDLARLTHHAEAAGDADAVLRVAPAAAERAAALGAHREAADQYARALRHGDRMRPDERAALLGGRGVECYLTDQNAEAIEAATAALELYRSLGDRLREGDALRLRSVILWCPGRVAESARDAEDAVSVLEELPPGRELGLAYCNLATGLRSAEKTEEALAWTSRALELGRRLDADAIVTDALITIGSVEALRDCAALEDALDELARRSGLDPQVARAFIISSRSRSRRGTTRSRTAISPPASNSAASLAGSSTGSTCSPMLPARRSTPDGGRTRSTPPHWWWAFPGRRRHRAS